MKGHPNEQIFVREFIPPFRPATAGCQFAVNKKQTAKEHGDKEIDYLGIIGIKLF